MQSSFLPVVLVSVLCGYVSAQEPKVINVGAFLHGRIQMNCSKEEGKIIWLHNSTLIVQYGVIKKEFSQRLSWNNPKENDQNLVIRDIEFSDIGLYECIADVVTRQYYLSVNGTGQPENRTGLLDTITSLPQWTTAEADKLNQPNHAISSQASLIFILVLLLLIQTLN